MFSVVIPLYNKSRSISATLNSVLAQDCTSFEVVVVDDGSTDGSAEIIKKIPDNRIRLFQQPNTGVSAARNRGIKEAKYNYIALLDADDLWEKNYLSEMITLIKDFPGAGMYGCAFDEVCNKKQYRSVSSLPDNYMGYVEDYFCLARKSFLFWTSAVILNKGLLGNKLGFDEQMSFGEDLDLWFRIAYHHKVAYLNKVLAHYNKISENREMSKHHAFHSSIISHTTKYQAMEDVSFEFRRFINWFRIQKIPELFLRYGLNKSERQNYLELIDPSGQGIKIRLFLVLPDYLQLLIIKKLKRRHVQWK